MHQWRKSRVKLNRHVRPLKANGVTDLVTIDMQRHDGGIDQTHFHIGVVSFDGDGFARLLARALLNLFDDEGHFLLGKGAVAVFAAVADGGSVALN